VSSWLTCIPDEIKDRYELHNFNHAVEILSQSYRSEFDELFEALRVFRLTAEEITVGGGSESPIPKKFSALLRPLQWEEIKISGDLVVKMRRRNPAEMKEHIVKDFIDGHNVDYMKSKIAIDVEWNSKDQTFDRDLYAFRGFYECGIISCAIIITRSESLNDVFRKLGIINKYGTSTTWMGKLLPRLRSRRHGGCPLLAIGITPKSIEGWGETHGE
jgi:hypothetical protein